MNKSLIRELVNRTNIMINNKIKIMEVCGTHTQMISKLGIKTILSSNIKLLSGPGCPVCVTDEIYIDTAIEILDKYNTTIVTFGDLLKVKGTIKSLMDKKSEGKDVRIIHSPLELIQMAAFEKDKEFIFLGVGFETTAPVIALTIKKCIEENITNIFFLTSIKLMEPILHYILQQTKSQIQGFICPGHVASIKGANYFRFIVEDYNIPAVVCGFDSLDIIGGIYSLVKQITKNEKTTFKNLYKRCVKPEGNYNANKLIEELFIVSDENWRGIGRIKNSSLTIKNKYSRLDARKRFNIKMNSLKVNTKICECSDILMGIKLPAECKFFGKVCNPLNPYGPCMVSTEGACSIAYKYREEG